jgi:hypothetical protein
MEIGVAWLEASLGKSHPLSQREQAGHDDVCNPTCSGGRGRRLWFEASSGTNSRNYLKKETKTKSMVVRLK